MKTKEPTTSDIKTWHENMEAGVGDWYDIAGIAIERLEAAQQDDHAAQHDIEQLMDGNNELLKQVESAEAKLVKRDVEIKRLEKSLRIAAGYIFTTNGHTHKHPQEILEWLKEQS